LVIPSVFVIDLYIDPASPRAQNDVYILLNEDGSEHQRRTVADDAVPGDDKLTLVFTELHRGLRYNLLIHEGAEGEYYAFHQVLLADLIQTDANPDAAVDAAGDQPEPKEYASLNLEEELPELPEEVHEHHPLGWEIADRIPTRDTNDRVG
jgi:hypothetical protein